jgi:RNA polymerase sigma-54 factor
MRFETAQHLKLGQHMKLAPRMIQSMEILQLPMLALQERIEQELESNVALELVEPGSEPGLDGEAAPVESDEASEEKLGRRELVVGEASPNGSDDFERLSAFESTYGDTLDNAYSSSERFSPSRMAGERDRKMDALANIAARGESLTEQLLHQWAFAEVEPEIAAIGERIIGYIDEDGLLSTDLETILEHSRTLPPLPGVELSIELLERVLTALQHWLEPPGIAARNQRECLLIQVEAMEIDPEINGHADAWADVRRLIEHHFEDLLQNRLPRIAQKTGLAMERIQSAIGLMRRLKLNPGRDLVDADVPPVIPDVLVEYDERSDSYVAALADGRLPTLRISPHYEQMAKDRALDKGTREFIGNNVRSASWLIESINQRNNTLLRVVNVVLSRQRDFFDHGPQHLKPLPMIEVADQLGVHVATVSRAVSDKWLQTPRGVVPLRRFFSGGTETEGGRDMSWEAVKAIMQEIVDGEDKTHPLSDDAIAAELKKRGIEIARRTVVKYRQQLNIPPARMRKVY